MRKCVLKDSVRRLKEHFASCKWEILIGGFWRQKCFSQQVYKRQSQSTNLILQKTFAIFLIENLGWLEATLSDHDKNIMNEKKMDKEKIIFMS